MSPTALALLCLLASGLLDFVFKLYAAKPRSRGILVCGIGCVWGVLQCIYISQTTATVALDSVTITYGLTAALFVTISNILLIECLGRLPISIASTIYRLNTIPLVIMAFLFLDESVGLVKIAGISAGVFTVYLLYQKNGSDTKTYRRFGFLMSLIIAASCIRALYGIFTKAGISNGGDPNTMMLLAAICWIIGGLLYAKYREKRVVLTREKLSYIFVAGLLVFGIVWLLTTALTVGDASVVVPIANMGFVAAFTISILLKLEPPAPRKLLAIGSAIAAIVLLTRVN